MQDHDTSFNIPSLLTVAFISYCIWRFFFNPTQSSSSSESSSSAASCHIPANRLRAINAVTDQVLSIYPQMERRTVMWDLQGNGNSIQATVERIMDNARGLDTPPPWFQPAMPDPLPSPQVPTTRPAPSSHSGPNSQHHSIIARYNLQERVQEEKKVEKENSTELSTTYSHDSASSGSIWSSNPEERRQMLAKRRDDMILAARRKLAAFQAGENRDDGGLLHARSAVSAHGEYPKR